MCNVMNTAPRCALARAERSSKDGFSLPSARLQHLKPLALQRASDLRGEDHQHFTFANTFGATRPKVCAAVCGVEDNDIETYARRLA